MDTSNETRPREKSLLKQGVTGASIQKLRNSGSEGILGIPQNNPLTVVHTLLSAFEPPDQRTDVPAENYDDAEEAPVPELPCLSGERGGSAPQ